MNKKNNGFKKLLFLTGLGSLLMVACHKDPTPTPGPQPTPTDSIPETPVTPIKTHDTIYWNWDKEHTMAPHHDTVVKRLTPELERLIIYVHGNEGINRPMDGTNWGAIAWTLAWQELSQNISIDSLRIRLGGTFLVSNANVVDPWSTEPGVEPNVKAKLENHGFTFILPRAITNNGKTR